MPHGPVCMAHGPVYMAHDLHGHGAWPIVSLTVNINDIGYHVPDLPPEFRVVNRSYMLGAPLQEPGCYVAHSGCRNPDVMSLIQGNPVGEERKRAIYVRERRGGVIQGGRRVRGTTGG